MGRAVVVSTARTGLAKAFRGGFNATHGAQLGGHAIKHAIAKAGIEAGAVEDVFLGCGMPEGETGMNIARNAALAGGCPVTTAGTTINRFCSSGLQAVAMAAQTILVDGVPVAIGGGLTARRRWLTSRDVSGSLTARQRCWTSRGWFLLLRATEAMYS